MNQGGFPMTDDPRAQTDLMRWVIDNIYTVARRESRLIERGVELRPEMWGRVMRLCEKAGAQERTVGVLREEPHRRQPSPHPERIAE